MSAEFGVRVDLQNSTAVVSSISRETRFGAIDPAWVSRIISAPECKRIHLNIQREETIPQSQRQAFDTVMKQGLAWKVTEIATCPEFAEEFFTHSTSFYNAREFMVRGSLHGALKFSDVTYTAKNAVRTLPRIRSLTYGSIPADALIPLLKIVANHSRMRKITVNISGRNGLPKFDELFEKETRSFFDRDWDIIIISKEMVCTESMRRRFEKQGSHISNVQNINHRPDLDLNVAETGKTRASLVALHRACLSRCNSPANKLMRNDGDHAIMSRVSKFMV